MLPVMSARCSHMTLRAWNYVNESHVALYGPRMENSVGVHCIVVVDCKYCISIFLMRNFVVIMATASGNVDLGQLTGHFDESVIVAYNICNINRYILNSFENTFNFCCQVKLLNKERQCDYCRRHLNLCLDRCDGHATPVVYRCTNRGCRKRSQYVSIRKGSVFESSNLSLQQILLIIS